MALFVNEATLLPVAGALAPAKTLAQRFPAQLATVLAALDTPQAFIAAEVEAMNEAVYTKTASRSVVGTMTEFTFMANRHRDRYDPPDLVELSTWLAGTPCSPLHTTYISPDRALHAITVTDRR